MFDVISHGNVINTQGSWLATAVTSIVLIWPACYIVHIVLELNFNVALVHENAALLVVTVPIITWSVASLWTNTWKLYIVSKMDKAIDRIIECCTRKPLQQNNEECA